MPDIACPVQESKYLNDDSIRFHSRLGFSEVGRFHDSGYKFNQWFDMVWMEKVIAEYPKQPALIKKIGELPLEPVTAVLKEASARLQ